MELLKIFKWYVALALGLAIGAMLLQYAVSCWLAPYELDHDVPIPNAVSTGEWEHEPAEGGVL